MGNKGGGGGGGGGLVDTTHSHLRKVHAKPIFFIVLLAAQK